MAWIRQPPCEAVSWNIISSYIISICIKSASLWGCELKYYFVERFFLCFRSASLWGCELKCSQGGKFCVRIFVSLLVRLWVEIILFCLCNICGQRQPPCEAVSWNWTVNGVYVGFRGQPPCEAVSWNIISSYIISICIKSASLWGCELKCRLAVSLIRL